jgi:hypothetical protein
VTVARGLAPGDDLDEITANLALLAAAPALEAALEACLQALKDASGVVDAGDGEKYAYQHEIAQAEAALAKRHDILTL